MRWVIFGVLFVVTIILAIFAAGAMLPLSHVASRKLKVNQPPEAVWNAITDHSDEPKWRSDLSSVVRLPDQNGHQAWQETYKDGMKLLLEDTEAIPTQKLVRQVKDSGNMFSGQWTFEITPVAGGSILTITERGEVPNPFFRFVSRFIMGSTKSIEQYMTALAGKFGEKAEFVRLWRQRLNTDFTDQTDLHGSNSLSSVAIRDIPEIRGKPLQYLLPKR
jgi:hypothetical protein